VYLYYNKHLNERRYKIPCIFPAGSEEKENMLICVKGIGMDKPFHSLIVSTIPDVQFTPNGQCFPFYTYSDDGISRKENITDWALKEFREYNKDEAISKQDIFYYTYGILNHPEYQEKYSTNLNRELPRIPYASDFIGFAEAGRKLAELHVNYEKIDEYPLQWIEDMDEKVNYRVERMKLSKDKTQIIYNDFVTLGGIPPEAFEYRLGNRSALEWIIDQYRVKTDTRSGITNDPNNPDNPQYIIHLIGKVITVSLETMKIVKSLPAID
jgi:predicted helicase